MTCRRGSTPSSASRWSRSRRSIGRAARPIAPADDGARQIIVYFNAVLRFVAAYDPSDWESLSPALIAGALGATDQGIFGLGPGRHEPGAEFRSHGSLVYRKTDDGWVATGETCCARSREPARPRAATPEADELVQRLAKLVMQSPETRGADREIITEEIDRALRNINLRLQREHEGVAVAAGPGGRRVLAFPHLRDARPAGRRPVSGSSRPRAAWRTRS